MEAYLTQFDDRADETKLEAGGAPQTNDWRLGEGERVVGMLKVRHRLTARIWINGGHIVYYIHGGYRDRGYGKAALALVVVELKKWGETEALITVDPENLASIKLAAANGAEYSDTVHDPQSDHAVNRYWIKR